MGIPAEPNVRITLPSGDTVTLHVDVGVPELNDPQDNSNALNLIVDGLRRYLIDRSRLTLVRAAAHLGVNVLDEKMTRTDMNKLSGRAFDSPPPGVNRWEARGAFIAGGRRLEESREGFVNEVIRASEIAQKMGL